MSVKKLHLKLYKIKVVIHFFSSFFSKICDIMDSHSVENEKNNILGAGSGPSELKLCGLLTDVYVAVALTGYV